MPFLPSFLPGYGAVAVASLAVAGAATVGAGLTVTGAVSATTTIQAGTQFLAPNGTAALPGYGFVTTAGQGLFSETSRVAMSMGSADKAYWSAAVNHNYQSVTVTGSLTATSINALLNYLNVSKRALAVDGTIAVATDCVIYADPTAGAIVVNLPTAASASGRIFIVRKINASANAVTIDPNAAETIDGAATLVVANTSAVMFQSDGSTWWTVGYEPIVPA